MRQMQKSDNIINVTELGDVNLQEIEPYILTRSTTLDMMPAMGWNWVK